MKRLLLTLILALITSTFPQQTHAAAGIFASGGGKKTVGQSFTVTVTASGTEFDSLQGTISVSGPVSVVSFSAGGATWLPGKTPANGSQFVGITSKTSSLRVATLTLKGTKEGSGEVSVSGVKLAKSGSVVASDGGNASFTIVRAPSLPGSIKVSSSSHPDQNQSYENKTIDLSWEKASGVSGFSYTLDQSDNTTPDTTVTSTDTSVKFENKEVGTYYFHIRAKNGDGWGATTHYKISIKEPDPKIDEAMSKPTITKIEKGPDFKTSFIDGTVQGIVIHGTVPVGYQANLTFTPSVKHPEDKSLSIASDATTGAFAYVIDYPIAAGFYKISVQGQKDKTLTPVSDTVGMEVSLLKGGSVTLLSEADTATPTPVAKVDNNDVNTKVQGDSKKNILMSLFILLGLLVIGVPTYNTVKRKRK